MNEIPASTAMITTVATISSSGTTNLDGFLSWSGMVLILRLTFNVLAPADIARNLS